MPSMKPYLDYRLENGAAKHIIVRWGQGYRKVIISVGKKSQYKGGDNINKSLKIKTAPLYRSMSPKPSKQITKTIKTDAAAKIHKLYKANKQTLKQEHAIQVTFSIIFSNETKHRTYAHDVFHVKGGKGSTRKAIQNDVDEVIMAVQEQYKIDGGVNPNDPDAVKIKHIYINKVKQDLTDFNHIKLVGTIFEFCGYGLDTEKNMVRYELRAKIKL